MSEPTLRFDPALVEEAVLLATDTSGPESRRRYRDERDRLYDVSDPDEREAGFRKLDARWFTRLDLDSPVRRLLAELPSIGPRISGCSILLAGRAKEEGADLHRARGTPIPSLVVKLTPTSLLHPERVTRLLRSELLHVEDMLDPDFGYETELPDVGGGTTYENLLRGRYRVLWNTTVDGRLAARGLLSGDDASRTKREFLTAFPMIGPSAEQEFERFLHGPRPSHREILAFAMGVSESCPLCELPMNASYAHSVELPAAIETAIRSEFPSWSPSQGACRQCTDLYGSRDPTRNVEKVDNVANGAPR